jgi:hypothetical protein
MFISLRSFVMPQQGGPLLLTAAAFAAGLTAGALLGPVSASRGGAIVAVQPQSPNPVSTLRSGHPADVLRVIDGDTFVARVHVWPMPLK